MHVIKHVLVSSALFLQFTQSTVQSHQQPSLYDEVSYSAKKCIDELYEQDTYFLEHFDYYRLMSGIMVELVNSENNASLMKSKNIASGLTELENIASNKLLIENTLGVLRTYYKNVHDTTLNTITQNLENFNAYLGKGTSVTFTLKDDKQKFSTFFKANLCEIKGLYDKITAELDGHVANNRINASLLDALKKEFEAMCKDIENLILEIDHFKIALEKTSTNFETMLSKTYSCLNTHTKLKQSIGMTLQGMTYVGRKTACCRDMIKNITKKIEELEFLVEFLSNIHELEFNRKKYETYEVAIQKEENPMEYVLNELGNLVMFSSDHVKTVKFRGDIFNKDFQHKIGFLQITIENCMDSIIETIQEQFKKDSLLITFNNLINTFCISYVDEADLSKKKYKVRRVIRNVSEFKDHLAKYRIFDIEFDSRNLELELGDAEILRTFSHLKYCLFSLRNDLTLLGDMEIEDTSLQIQNLVNLLSGRIFTVFGTINSLFETIDKEQADYLHQKKITIQMLDELSTILIQNKNKSLKVDALPLSSRGNETATTLPKALLNDTFSQAKTKVSNMLEKMLEDRLKRYQNRDKEAEYADGICMERSETNARVQKTERYINIKKKADEVHGLIDELNRCMTKAKDRFDEDSKKINLGIKKGIDILNVIVSVYEEDMKLICLEALLTWTEKKRVEYNNKTLQSHQIAILASIDMEIVDLTTKMIISYANKTRLIRHIGESQFQTLKSLSSLTINELNSVNASADKSGNLSSEFLTIPQQITEKIELATEHYSKHLLDWECKEKYEDKTKDNQKKSFDAMKNNIRIISSFIDKYLKQEDLINVNNQEVSNLETKVEYYNWIRQFGEACEHVSAIFSKRYCQSLSTKTPEPKSQPEQRATSMKSAKQQQPDLEQILYQRVGQQQPREPQHSITGAKPRVNKTCSNTDILTIVGTTASSQLMQTNSNPVFSTSIDRPYHQTIAGEWSQTSEGALANSKRQENDTNVQVLCNDSNNVSDLRQNKQIPETGKHEPTFQRKCLERLLMIAGRLALVFGFLFVVYGLYLHFKGRAALE